MLKKVRITIFKTIFNILRYGLLKMWRKDFNILCQPLKTHSKTLVAYKHN